MNGAPPSLPAGTSPTPSILVRQFATSDAPAAIGGGNAPTTSFSAGSGVTTLPSGEEGGGGGLLGKLFFSSLCVLTFGLGSWQTKRYFEKVEMVHKREDDLGMDPLPTFDDWSSLKNTIDTTKTDGSALEKSYRRVHLHGEYQHQHEILIGPRGPPPGALAESGPNSGRGGGGGMSSSAQGYLVVTPFVVSNDAFHTQKSRGANSKRGWVGWLFDKSSESPYVESTAASKEKTIVWVNRGWIPRDYINKYNEIVWSWERPRGMVRLMAMESNIETPGAFAPPSRLETMKRAKGDGPTSEQKNEPKSDCLTCPRPTPPVTKLLWMDRQAMEELTSCDADCHPPLFVEIKTNENDNIPAAFPAKASQEFVGEFKVTPAIHAGYAFTWFGLSSAGIFMTRKLLSKGK